MEYLLYPFLKQCTRLLRFHYRVFIQRSVLLQKSKNISYIFFQKPPTFLRLCWAFCISIAAAVVCVCGLVSSLRGRRHLCAFFPQAEPGGSTHPEAARTALQPWGCFHFCTWKLSKEAEAVASETASAFAKASNCQYQEKWIWTKAGFVRSSSSPFFRLPLHIFFFCNRKIEDPFRVLLHYWWCAAFKRNCFCKNDGLLLLCLLFSCFFFWKMTASLICCMH